MVFIGRTKIRKLIQSERKKLTNISQPFERFGGESRFDDKDRVGAIGSNRVDGCIDRDRIQLIQTVQNQEGVSEQ